MPINPTTGIGIAALIVIVGALVAVSYQQRITANNASPSPTTTTGTNFAFPTSPTPSPLMTNEPTMSFTPLNNSTSTHVSINQQTGTIATPHATSQPAANSTTSSPRRIVFVDTPTAVHSGQSFTVTWRIEGPAGETGSQTTIMTHLAVTKDSSGSHSSSTTNNTNSFGSFTVPATYSTNLSYAGDPGTIEVTVTAEINGQTLTAERNISLVD